MIIHTPIVWKKSVKQNGRASERASRMNCGPARSLYARAGKRKQTTHTHTQHNTAPAGRRAPGPTHRAGQIKTSLQFPMRPSLRATLARTQRRRKACRLWRGGRCWLAGGGGAFGRRARAAATLPAGRPLAMVVGPLFPCAPAGLAPGGGRRVAVCAHSAPFWSGKK